MCSRLFLQVEGKKYNISVLCIKVYKDYFNYTLK